MSRLPNNHHRTPCRQSRPHGFTLIEVLTVVSIILILASIGVVGGTHIRDGARESQARTMMHSLKSIATTYEGVMGYVVNDTGDTPIDWTQARPFNVTGATGTGVIDGDDWFGSYVQANLSIERFVAAVDGLEETSPMLDQANRGHFGDWDGDGFLEFRDPWENPVLYERRSESDGSHTAAFVSAGVDGIFGTDDDIRANELE